MKYGSTYYPKEKVSSCEIAGAVALCAVHDLRVNLFRFSGFPQIVVKADVEGFIVTVSIDDDPPRAASFLLTKDEAFEAAKRFKETSEFKKSIFDKVQDALAKVVG